MIIVFTDNIQYLSSDRISQARKEVEQLRMEREILKKAAVFFAKEVE
jgi:transposase